jgi:hypothetical protein
MKSTLNELQDGTDNDSGEECTMYVQTAETYGEPLSDVDIEMPISKLKNRKATGHDQIPAELINPLNTELNPICHLLALLGARHILHVSRIRVKEGGKEMKKVICEHQLKKNMGRKDHTI